jgi:predicted CoA-substrate-specific enzyme activase
MFQAGIDIGAENIKMVILKDDNLIASNIIPCGWDTRTTLMTGFEAMLKQCNLSRESILSVGVTGMGREIMSFSMVCLSESNCSARGAVWAIPSARTVIDIGAEQCQALTCDGAGRVSQYVRNDNCAAGAGAFLEAMAEALESNVSDMADLANQSKNNVSINSTCTIFAESEVISLINEGTPKEAVARAVCDVIANKTVGLLGNLKIHPDVILIGGVSRNSCITGLLEQKLNQKVLIPENAGLVTAAGAALIASQNKG